METNQANVVISCALQDAGEATRSLAIAEALRAVASPERPIDVTFLTHGSRFEGMVRDAGFRLHECAPRMEGRSVVDDLGWAPPEIIGSSELAYDLIQGERAALRELAPDLVLHGFWPFANIAARMLTIPTAAFLPLPLHPESIRHGLMTDLPDEVPALLTRLPRSLRRLLVRLAAPLVPAMVPAFTQHNVPKAARAAGWEGSPLRKVFDILKTDLTVINDLPEFYEHTRLPQGFVVTGRVFAPGDDLAAADPAVVDVLTRNDTRPVVLLTMGSSGTRESFLAALRAVADPGWRAVVLASPAICSLAEAQAHVAPHDGLVITDQFVPARAVTSRADVVVSHGGQGTVQTSLAAGVPTVGVGMQAEQQINLQHVEMWGAGIRIPKRSWTPQVIHARIRAVLADTRYADAARGLATRMRDQDGAAAAAREILTQLSGRSAA